jgi:N-acetylmuramoyl-L-alanine amidase
MAQALSLLLAALLAASSGREGRTPPSGRRQGRAPAGASAGARASPLEEARASLKSLMADRQRRRYHHHWDRAIQRLLAAARGPEAAEVTLEAARARYALYRWSADEADRDEALRLAAAAARLGARQAVRFAAAVRREAGDERPPPRPAPPPVPGTKGRAAPEPGPRPEDVPQDPELESAVAALSTPAPALGLGQSADGRPANVSAVKAWSSEDYTRVAIYLDRWVGWQQRELPARDGAPRRLALDFRPALLDGAALARSVAGGQVDRVRAAQHDAETVRVVLDLPGNDALRFYGLDDPPRLIVDVGTRAAAREARIAAARPGERPTPERPGDADEGGELRPIRRVVVDAGHGGLDPGAIGPTRVREKDVTLAISRRLAARLRRAGFEVIMTRSDDRFVALEERTAIANTQRGDLFISIHANANPRRTLAGTETWILNVADDRYAKRLAARENGVEPEEGGEGGEAQRILTDLDAKVSTGASRRLAQVVQREITSAVRARFGEDQDLGVKSALFYVLVGARMPAVLVETAFISNRREEKRLASSAYQDDVSAAISRAVEQFARRDPRLARSETRSAP